MKYQFENFCVGDTVSFSRVFSHNDFSEFSKLSGDENPLYHDNEYAQASGYGDVIVPLHLIISPISRMAGMHLPGEPSLYLSHSVRAVSPLKYGEPIMYSAKIIAKNSSKRVLTIKVLGISGVTIIFDGEIQTQARFDCWDQQEYPGLTKASAQKRVLITGASGEIAASTARLFHKNGWNLILQSRDKNSVKFDNFPDNPSQNVDLVQVDLSEKNSLAEFVDYIQRDGGISAVVHTASPPVSAPLNELVSVNYSAMRSITEALLPQMLARQEGVLLCIGSSAMLSYVPGLEDYAAAKSMTVSYLEKINKKFKSFGVCGRVLAPTYVSTRYSSAFRGEALSLMPYEVADEIFDMVKNSVQFMRRQDVDTVTEGDFGFSFSTTDSGQSIESISLQNGQTQQSRQKKLDVPQEKLVSAIKRILHSALTNEIQHGGMDSTPGWDSLAQIQILLEVEKEFKISFSSNDFEKLRNFSGILDVITLHSGQSNDR